MSGFRLSPTAIKNLRFLNEQLARDAEWTRRPLPEPPQASGQYLGVFPDYRSADELAEAAREEVVPAPSFQMEFDGENMTVSLPRNLTREGAAALVGELLDLYGLTLVDVSGLGRAAGSELRVSYFQDSPIPKGGDN